MSHFRPFVSNLPATDRRNNRAKDILGQRFGRLVVTARAGTVISRSDRIYATWWCRCDCGNVKEARGFELRAGSVKSCGCLRLETLHLSNKQRQERHMR